MSESNPRITLNPVTNCLIFFEKGVPEPANKNIHTQIGCHFEEVGEMIDEITGLDPQTSDLLANARGAITQLADHLKASDQSIQIHPANRANFLDAICDQFVTGVGSAYMLKMDVSAAIDLTNLSNLSKFDEHGEPIFNENMKIMKGPNYFKTDLTPFV